MEPFLGQIQAFGFGFAPRGWALCQGQLLAISQNTALFSLLGTTYGGDGRTTFALPDLRSRSIVGVGQGPGLDSVLWGDRGGQTQVSLNQTNLPSHTHSFSLGAKEEGDIDVPAGAFVAGDGTNAFGSTSDVTLAAQNVNPTGGNVPFNNRNPYLGMYYCIAVQGIYPSRN